MITYDFEKAKGPIYLYVYECLKKDIIEGKLQENEKLPSKRTFARNNGISTITIQNAYDQLISEGYIYTIPKKGYYVAHIEHISNETKDIDVQYKIKTIPKSRYNIDLSDNSINSDNFPFSVWTRLSREVMSNKKDELMTISPVNGVYELREAIAKYLQSFRGMLVDPNQIVVGAGTEFLYGIIMELLGKKKIFAIENPGYKKLEMIYKQKDICCRYVQIDDEGMTIESLKKSKADVAHMCPNHHFPTGITMPASRRYEILAWANEKEKRYIIEDDYDSEFRTKGRPLPTLFSIDGCEKVIYMNTFSKSLSPTIRISYMVLPIHLANIFYEKMSFYSCTVSNFEQYTLAEFIKRGYFEKHINRMRLYYARQRKTMIDIICNSSLHDRCMVKENDSGLHFLLRLDTNMEDSVLKEELAKHSIKIRSLSDYYFTEDEKKEHLFIINYSNIEKSKIKKALEVINDII